MEAGAVLEMPAVEVRERLAAFMAEVSSVLWLPGGVWLTRGLCVRSVGWLSLRLWLSVGRSELTRGLWLCGWR